MLAGIDLGGTQVRVALARSDGQLIASFKTQDPAARHTAKRGRLGGGRDRAAPRPREGAQHHDRRARPDRHQARRARQPAQPSGLAQRAARGDAQKGDRRHRPRRQRRRHGRPRRVPPRRRPRHPEHGLHHLVDRRRRRSDHRWQAASRRPRDRGRGRPHDHRRQRSARPVRAARLPRGLLRRCEPCKGDRPSGGRAVRGRGARRQGTPAWWSSAQPATWARR